MKDHYLVDAEYENFTFSNPNMGNPDARLFIAILDNAIHDAVAAQSGARVRQQALDWLENDDGLIYYCLGVSRISRDGLLRRVREMRDNNINLKNMYTRRDK